MAKKILFAVLVLALAAVLVFVLISRQKQPSSPDYRSSESEIVSPSVPSPTPEVEKTPEPMPEPTLTPEPEPEPENGLPDIDISSWEYLLVNAEHSIGDYVPELSALEGGHLFDSRALAQLEQFIAAARDAGHSVFLSSAYRSYSEQEYLFNRKVSQYGGNEAVAATIVARPGTSEHQSGLSCDITDRYYELKDASLENTALFKWMSEHCAEFGFILRYPSGKEEITGVIYEPWHFRYVGVEAATYIVENDLCLEEFLAFYE